jgi:hypothetical protein
MAFLDFLGQGMGGMQQAQGPNQTGGAGVSTSQPIGPTYGDALQMGLQYGSKPGSSGPMVAGAIPNSGWQQRSMQPLAPNAPPQAKQPVGATGEGTGNDVLKMIESFFRAMLLSGGA